MGISIMDIYTSVICTNIANAFTFVFNMSITASYVIIAILLVRLLLRKAPKKYSYILWSVVGFRLTMPISLKSVFSIFSLKPFDMSGVQNSDIGTMDYMDSVIGSMSRVPTVDIGIQGINHTITHAIEGVQSFNRPHVVMTFQNVFSLIWLAVMTLMIIYVIASYVILKVKMSKAILRKDNIYESDKVSSPFILGFIPPKIYIPFGLDDEVYQYVTEHEKCHLRRYDYYVKALAFIILAVHWFNPLCWLAFALMNRDMEMSCDEWVLSHNANIKKQYSTALLSFATNKKAKSITPLCFSESSVGARIKNILKFKKPNILISIICIVLCTSIVLACALNPKIKENIEDLTPDNISYNEITTPNQIIESLNNILIKETNGLALDELSISAISSATGAQHISSSEAGEYTFRYNDSITFTLLSRDYGLGNIISIVYYYDGDEYAYTDENRKLMFNTELFEGLLETSYKPFFVKNEYAAFNSNFNASVKNQSGGTFRIMNSDAKYAGIDGLDSKYSRSIEYLSSDKQKQTLLVTFYQDLHLLAYIDDNLFFSVGDTIYRMKITYKDNRIFSKEIFFVIYGQYIITDTEDNTLILKSGDNTLYFNTITGLESSYNMSDYTAKISQSQTDDTACKIITEKTGLPLSRFERSAPQLLNSNALSREINKGAHPLYLFEFKQIEGTSEFYRIYIDAQTGEAVYFGTYGD